MMTEQEEEYQKALDKVSYYLSVRDHTLKELNTKLCRKFSPEVVGQVLEKAIDLNWITSPKEMAAKVKDTLDMKRKGFLYISQYLRQKGLPAVDKNEEIEIEKACDIINQHFKQPEGLSYDEKHKALRLLKNRGFDLETINKVIYDVF